MPNNRYAVSYSNIWKDAMLYGVYIRKNTDWVKVQEGDPYRVGASWIPILRETVLSLGIRTSGINMTLTYASNNVLKSNPTIVIMGSSTSIGYGLPADQTIQYKLQQYANANWGGATIHNIGVAGQWSTNWLPAGNPGSDPASNIDAALAFNPDFIILMGPTNDALNITKGQWLANLNTIVTYARERGADIYLSSPLPRTPFSIPEQQYLADSTAMQMQAFPYRMWNWFDSALRLKPPASSKPAEGNPIYFQADTFHLNDAGTTYATDGFVIPTLERELRAITYAISFRIERSIDGMSGWTLFDTITDPQQIRKTYPKQPGYYRVTALLKDGNYMPFSNVRQVTNIPPTVNVGSDQTLPSGTTSTTVTATASDPDGTIVSYLWSVTSGGGITFSPNATAASPTVNGLANSQSYTLQCTVTDNNGATAADTLNITVGAPSVLDLFFNFSDTQDVVGYASIKGSPNGAVRSGMQGGITVDTVNVGTTYWGTFGSNVNDVNGEDTANPVFALSAEATRSYMYTYNTQFDGTNYNLRLSGFNPGEVVPEIALLGSRDASGVAAATRLMDINVKDAGGNELYPSYDVKGNTANLAVFANKVADGSGQVMIAIHRKLPFDPIHEFGYINAIRIKRTA